MHRQPLLRLLADYRATCPEQAEVVAQIVDLVESHADCLLRTCRPGHITGAAWVVSSDRQRCLLVHHRKLGKWIQPGGHADGDPDVAAVALREAQEETGLQSLRLAARIPLDVDVHDIPERRDAGGRLLEDAHQHHDIRFLLVADSEETPTVSHESHDVRWFTRSELEQWVDEVSVLLMARKAGP